MSSRCSAGGRASPAVARLPGFHILCRVQVLYHIRCWAKVLFLGPVRPRSSRARAKKVDVCELKLCVIRWTVLCVEPNRDEIINDNLHGLVASFIVSHLTYFVIQTEKCEPCQIKKLSQHPSLQRIST